MTSKTLLSGSLVSITLVRHGLCLTHFSTGRGSRSVLRRLAQIESCQIINLWLWPATDCKQYCRHVPTNKIQRPTEITSQSSRWCIQVAGINSNYSTRDMNEITNNNIHIPHHHKVVTLEVTVVKRIIRDTFKLSTKACTLFNLIQLIRHACRVEPRLCE